MEIMRIGLDWQRMFLKSLELTRKSSQCCVRHSSVVR